MTRIDYYFNAPGGSVVAQKLVVKAFNAGGRVLLFTRDKARGKEIDLLFWTSPLLSFIPHVACNHPLAGKTPILIGDDASQLESPDVLINLDSDVPDCFARFERVLEIVSEDAADRESARNRFRYYKERGYSIEMHDLKAPK